MEREERQANQVARLKGLDCEVENEPSHTLIDRAFASFSKNQFAKIEWKDIFRRLRPLSGLHEAKGSLNAILPQILVTFSSLQNEGPPRRPSRESIDIT